MKKAEKLLAALLFVMWLFAFIYLEMNKLEIQRGAFVAVLPLSIFASIFLLVPCCALTFVCLRVKSVKIIYIKNFTQKEKVVEDVVIIEKEKDGTEKPKTYTQYARSI